MKTNINAGVKVEAITFFVRHNEHSKRDEMFVCITMLSVGAIYVTFTRYDTEFAKSVKVGDVFVVSGKFKREQVLRIAKIGKFQNVKLFVTLKKPNGKVRIASWGYFSTITVRR